MALLNPFLTQRARSIRSAIVVLAMLVAVSARAEETILVLKSRDLPQYGSAVESFVQEWKSHGTGARVEFATLENAADNLAGTLSASGKSPGAVVAVGTEAAQWAIQHTTGIVVFCMVANAQQNVLGGLSQADAGRVCGVALDVPVRTQFKSIAELLPKASRIGVLYDPKKSERALRDATEAARGLGFEIVAQPVADESVVPDATEQIVSRIDLLWAPVDSTVYNSRSARFVLGKMVEHKIPVIGFSENMVKAGALLAPCVRYPTVGKQTAQLLATVLAGKAVPADGLQPPTDFDFVVNRRVLRLMNDPIPKSKLSSIRFVNEE